jgi:arabinogalactan oligomer/maltooligosaccharide transport system permease protein
MIINGDWSWGGYLAVDSKIDAAIAPLPVVDATGLPMAPMIDAKGFCLSTVSRGSQADWAMHFVQHMTSVDAQRRALHQLRILPSRQELYDDPLFTSDATINASLRQLQHGRRTPVISELRAVWDAMRPHYQSLLGGNESPEVASAGMQQSAELLIHRMQSEQRVARNANVIFSGALLAFAAVAAWWQRDAHRRLPVDLWRQPVAYGFIIPSIVVLLATIAYPFGYNVALSFSNMTLNRFRDWSITGWQNYIDVFTSPKLLIVLVNTIVWTFVNVFFHVVLGVFLAVMLHGAVAGKSLYRVILILPWAIPSYITALTWRGMFDYHYGAINRLATTFLGIDRIDWLGDEHLAFVACLITNIWLGVPFMMVITLGGLQGISPELYDAARIDRASRWAQFWHITVPLLRPVLVPAVTLGTIWTFNNLNVIWLVSNGGQPADQTHILVSYVYRAVFNLYQFGFGAALSMVIFALLLGWSALFLAVTRGTESV